MVEHTKAKVLFLCTGNSCRSQMAEGWARHLFGDKVEAYSAGTDPHGMNSRAVRVMQEAGVDMSSHRSKHLSEFLDVVFDCVVTVCNNAHESCPTFPGAHQMVHRSFDDPPQLAKGAKGAKDEEGALIYYRRVRDEIREFVISLLDHT